MATVPDLARPGNVVDATLIRPDAAALSPSDYASVAAAVAAALSINAPLQLRPGDAAIINVPAQVASIGAAVTAVRSWIIPDGATLTIQVATGSYSLTNSIVMDHPDGARIRIYGDRTTPANCVLTSTNDNDILYVPIACAIGDFDGFRLVKSGTKARIGVLTDGGSITCGPMLEIDNFYYGIAARYGGTIIANGTSASNRVWVTNAGDVGIWAYNGSHISCRYALVEGSIDVANNLGFGIMAEHGASIEAQYSIARACYRAGIASYTSSDVRAYNTTVEDNTGHGYDAYAASALVAHSGVSQRNGGWGANLDDTSAILASPAITYSTNALGDRIPRLERFFSSQAGIRPEGGSGNDSLRIDARGSGGVFFNTGGGAQFEIAHATTVVNRMAAQGAATGAQPRFYAVGSDANISMRYDTKGTGSHFFNTSGGTSQVEIPHVASAVNRLRFAGGPAGDQVSISAAGSDTNVTIRYDSKGSGAHFFNTAGGSPQFEIAHTASSVNRIRVSGAATGGTVGIYALGSDTDIPIRIDSRGSASVFLNPGGNNRLEITPTGALIKNGSATVIHVNATGLGFYGFAPVAQQTVTGSRASGAALTSFLSCMASLGLIVDGTSA